jgi:hypothetical protein
MEAFSNALHGVDALVHKTGKFWDNDLGAFV